MKYSILLLIIAIILIGCNAEQNEIVRTYDGFPEVVKLYGKTVTEINFFSKRGAQLCIVDTFLVLKRTGFETDILHIYNLYNMNLISKLGVIGKGQVRHHNLSLGSNLFN